MKKRSQHLFSSLLLFLAILISIQSHAQKAQKPEGESLAKGATFKKILDDKNLTYKQIVAKCDSLFADTRNEMLRKIAENKKENNTANKGSNKEKETEETGEDGAFTNYMRWRRFWAPRIDINTGKPHSFAGAKTSAGKNLWRSCGETNDGNWRFIGPKNLELPHLGRVQCISVNPSNTNEIYISDYWGGLWKTTNRGTNWTCLTDNDVNLAGLGVQKFVVDYSTSPNTIVAAVGYVGEGLFANLGNRTADVYVSVDDGQTYTSWGIGLNWDDEDFVSDMAAHPTHPEVVFVATKFKLIRFDVSSFSGGVLLDYDHGSLGSGSSTYVKSRFSGFHSITFLSSTNPFQPNPMFVSTRGTIDGQGSSATLLRTWDCLSTTGVSFTDITTNLSTTGTPPLSATTNLVDNGAFDTSPDQWIGTDVSNPVGDWVYDVTNQNVSISGASNPPSTITSNCLEQKIPGFYSPNQTSYTFSGTFTLPAHTRLKVYMLDYSHVPHYDGSPACADINAVPTLLIYNSNSDPNKVTGSAYNSQPVTFNNGLNVYYNRLVFQVEYDPGYSGGDIIVDNVVLNGVNLYHIATASSKDAPTTLFSMVSRWQNKMVYVVKSTDYGATWTNMGNIDDIVDNFANDRNDKWVAVYEDMEMSTVDANKIYHSLQYLKLFTNGETGHGVSNTAHLYAYDPSSTTPTHADVRSILTVNTGANTEEVFVGHDGGLSVFANGSWSCLTCDEGFESSLPYGIGSDDFSGNIGITALDNGGLESDIGDNYTNWAKLSSVGGDGFYFKYAKRYALKNTYLWTDNTGSFVGLDLKDKNNVITGGSVNVGFHGYLGRPKVTEAGEYYADDHVFRLRLVGTNAVWDDLSTTGSWTIPANTAIPAVAGHPVDADIIAGYAGNEFDGGSGKFFITMDGGNNWNISSSNPFGGNMIMDMCFDPSTTSSGSLRLWASAGWYGSAGTNRVFVSANSGTSWTDYSTGLPDGPVNSIVYDEQGKYLFAATDIGVYYRFIGFGANAEWNEWKCFSQNMPNCIVNDLDINRCAGKLYAASYGRGAWETDLPANWGFSNPSDPDNTIVIGPGTPEYWNTGDRYLTKNVVIPNGAKLIIQNCTINMARNKNFEVEVGGVLVLDNAVITNTCKCMWGSIIVKGDPTQPQTYNLASETSNMGFLIMRNSSRLEHAYLGILASNAYYDGDDYPAYASGGDGGLVIAENSSFINCTKSAAFTDYNFMQNSVFDNCQFIANDFLRDYTNYTDYSAPTPRRFGSKAFITSWASHGLEIKNSTFNNALSVDYNPDRDLWPMGIGGGGANFTVDNCTFNNLSRGILVAGDHGTSNNTTITNCDFNDVWRSITCRQANNVGIEKNTITIGEALQYEHRTMEEDPSFEFGFDPYGIYYSYGTGFWIFDNEIDQVSTASETYGVILNDINNVTAPYLSTYSVYRNKIVTDYGVVGNQDSRGAQIKCNDLNTNKHGIMVTSYEVEGAPTMNGMLSDQGYCSNNQTPAGNKFNQYFGGGSGPCSNEHLFSSSGNPLNSGSNSFDYYHHSPNPYVPLCASSPAPIGIISCPVNCNNNDCCPDPPPYIVPEEPGKNIVATPVSINADLETADRAIADLNIYIAKGDNEDYYKVLDNVSATSADVKKQLVNAGGYLSDRILIKAITRVPAMDHADLKEILVANSALKAPVWEALVQARPELANDENLRKAQAAQSSRRGVEGAIADFYVEKNRQLMRLAHYYNKKGMWKECGSLYAKEGAPYTAMSYYLQTRDFSEARKMADQIMDNDLKKLSHIIIRRAENKETAGKFSAEDREALLNLAYKPYTQAGDAARLMLGQNYGFIPLELMPKPTNGVGKIKQDRILNTSSNFKIYPNPAVNQLNVSVVNGTFGDGTLITVFDITGRKMLKIVPESNSSVVQVNTSAWLSGLYMVSMSNASGKIQTEKVNIIK